MISRIRSKGLIFRLPLLGCWVGYMEFALVMMQNERVGHKE